MDAPAARPGLIAAPAGRAGDLVAGRWGVAALPAAPPPRGHLPPAAAICFIFDTMAAPTAWLESIDT